MYTCTNDFFFESYINSQRKIHRKSANLKRFEFFRSAPVSFLQLEFSFEMSIPTSWKTKLPLKIQVAKKLQKRNLRASKQFETLQFCTFSMKFSLGLNIVNIIKCLIE